MYSKVTMLPVTGTGTASAGFAFAIGWYWVFAVIAAFTIVCAFGAAVRTAPSMRFLYREPKQLAPKGRPQRPGSHSR